MKKEDFKSCSPRYPCCYIISINIPEYIYYQLIKFISKTILSLKQSNVLFTISTEMYIYTLYLSKP